MADVLYLLPIVVHPVNVQRHEICVNGRDWHYLCGVTGTENVIPRKGKDCLSSVEEGFKLKLLDRKLCSMYPEVKLGGFINSASAQWQVIDYVFNNVLCCKLHRLMILISEQCCSFVIVMTALHLFVF
jgi:hypothetical protein